MVSDKEARILGFKKRQHYKYCDNRYCDDDIGRGFAEVFGIKGLLDLFRPTSPTKEKKGKKSKKSTHENYFT